MDKYILAHDLGTSGNKASIFSVGGRMIGSYTASYETNYFNTNYVEQDAEDWWKAVCESTQALISKLSIAPEDILTVSFSGQMMGCLCVDREGMPLRNSIIWADSRAQKQVQQIEEHISQEEFYKIVGHRNTASYGVQKLMWVRDNEPEIYEKTYKMLNAKDFIVHRLTNNFYTDYSDGNSNGCFDLNTLSWSERIIEASQIDPDKLPELKPSTFVAGKVTEEASKACGLAVGTPVVLGAGDGVTASVGAGSIRPGKTYSSIGTSAWITTTTEKPIFDPQMRTVTWAHAIPGLYAPNGTMQYAGGAYNWVKNNLGQYETEQAKIEGTSAYELINEQIENTPAGSNGIIFLPYLIGERAPRWDANAKGAFIGIKSENERGDLLRSVLEGVTMNLALILDVLRDHIDISEMVVIGGGAKGEVWRQMMADIYNLKVQVPNVLDEASSMGAAVIGGVGAGIYEDFDVISQFIEINAVHHPNHENEEEYSRLKEKFDACYYALKDVFPEL